MQEPLNDSLGLNSTGEIQEQQVVPGVPPPGQPATAGNGEQTGIPPALLVGGAGDEAPAGPSTEGIGANGHSPADEDAGGSTTLSKKSSQGRSVGHSKRSSRGSVGHSKRSSRGSSSDSSLTSGGSYPSARDAFKRRQSQAFANMFMNMEAFEAFMEEHKDKYVDKDEDAEIASTDSPKGVEAVGEDAAERILKQRSNEMALKKIIKDARDPTRPKVPPLNLGADTHTALNGVLLWAATSNAQAQMGNRNEGLDNLILDCASMAAPSILGVPRRLCLHLGGDIAAGTATKKTLATPIARAVLAIEAEDEDRARYQFLQALEASTVHTGGYLIVKRIVEAILTEMASKVSGVRFLYELRQRLEQQHNATSGTSVESSIAAANEFLTKTGAQNIRPGSFVEDITKKYSDVRSMRECLRAANVDHQLLGDAAAQQVQLSMPSDFLSIYISSERTYEMLHGKSPPPPGDRAERFLYFSKILAGTEARALHIAAELDRAHYAHEEKRKTAAAATAAAQSKASSDKVARDKAAAEALATAKQQSKAAGKQRLQANAATFTGCYLCSATDHTAAQCKFTSKVCALCHSTDHLRRDCKKNGGAQAPAS